MDAKYRERAEDWVTWFMYNKNPNMPLEQKVKFQERCILGLFEMLARTVDELERIETGHNRPMVLLPTGLTLHDPIKERE